MKSLNKTIFPIVLALLLFAAVAGGQQMRIVLDRDEPVSLPSRGELKNVEIDDEVLRQTRLLDDADWQTRNTARQFLVNSSVNNEQFYALLEFEKLTSEQRHRLVQIVWDRLVNSPGGALGITMNPLARGRGVVVRNTLPGMPAEKVLKRDDRIVRINGKSIATTRTLQNLVQGHSAGDTVTMTLSRPKRDDDGQIVTNARGQTVSERMQVEITLGSAEDLEPFERSTNSRTNPVRERIAREVLNRYPIDLSVIETEPEEAGRISQSDATSDVRVEHHPDILSLKSRLQTLERRGNNPTPAEGVMWEAVLLRLQTQAQNPRLSVEKRQFLRKVIKRYRELLPE